ncbi:sugar phosphate isomerase/epimerase family protein [Enterococcus olivae]
MKPEIALQLWSIQEECQQDFAAALQQVKTFGYDGVEFAGYHGKTAVEIKDLLTETGLKVAGSHVRYEDLKNNLEETLDFEQAIGNSRVVIPYASFQTFEEWQAFAKEVQTIAQEAAKRDLTLYYHNHAHEFSEIENQDLLDFLTKNVKDLRLEVDLYWLAFAGKEVLPWIDAHQEQVGLFHVKDKQADPEESTELGSGTLPLAAYLEKAKELALPWLVVEQEAFQTLTPLEAAQVNVERLQQLVEEVYQ